MTPEQITILEALESSGRPWTPEGGIRAFPGGTRPIPDSLGALGGLMDKVRGTPLEYLLPFQGTLEAWGNNQQPGYLANLEAALDLAPGVGKAASAGLAGGAALGRMMSGGIDDLVRELGPLGRQVGAVKGLRTEGGRSVFDVGGKTYNTMPVGEPDPSFSPKLSAKAKAEDRYLPAIHGDQSGGMALVTPWKDKTRGTVDAPKLSRLAQPEKPAELKPLDALIATFGDRSDFGRYLRDVNGRPLSKPELLTGGFKNMMTDDVWASGDTVVSGLHNQAMRALEAGAERPILFGMPQGSSSLGFSSMLTDIALPQVLEGMSPKGLAMLEQAMKSPTQKNAAPYPDFPGWDSPKLEDWFYGKHGDRRHDFIDRLDTAAMRKEGAPALEDLRYGINDPKLLTTPDMYGGQYMAEYSGNRRLDPGGRHEVYPHVMEGKYAGGYEHPIPYPTAFPELFAQKRAEGKKLSDDAMAFRRIKPYTILDQELLDQFDAIQRLGQEEGLNLGRILL